MEAEIHAELACCFVARHLELELVQPLTQQQWRSRVPVACGRPPGGLKRDIHLTLRGRDCNATADPQASIRMSCLYTYVAIT